MSKGMSKECWERALLEAPGRRSLKLGRVFRGRGLALSEDDSPSFLTC